MDLAGEEMDLKFQMQLDVSCRMIMLLKIGWKEKISDLEEKFASKRIAATMT